MAKRFLDTNIFRKKWIRKLDPDMKLFWIYLLTDCDHAGIWDVDIERASFQLNMNLEEEKILNTFGRKIITFKKDKWFIPKFVAYQYGELNENNRAHLSVIKILNKYKLGPSKGLISISEGDKDIIKDKNKNKKNSKKDQLETIKSNLDAIQSDFAEINVRKEFEKFVDYLDANGKKYKNYNAGFRNWLRNDSFGKTKIENKKLNKVMLACPAGHIQREVNRGVRAVCPTCRVTMQPKETLNLEKMING